MATITQNKYLQGNLAPVREEVTATELEVTGTIPAHLDGRYLRNGPNPVVDPDPATYHWFTGTGMIHGVRLRDGRAEWYRNRWVRSADVAEALGEEPHPGPVHAGLDFSANTHVIGQAGRTFAIVEAGFRPYELTDELDTIGPCDFDGTLPGGYTAHTKRDPDTGEVHAVSYFFGSGPQVQYSVLGVDARIRRTVDIPVHGSPMMHDLSLTDDHIVLYDLPVALDMDKIAAGGTITMPYTWDPTYPARVGVMPRDGGADDVRWFDIEPCYVFHPMNAYDDGDRVVLDVVRHPKMFATDHHGPNEGPPTLDRWTVDLAAGKVTEERLDDRPLEFPRVNERLTGRRHRYGYAVGLPGDEPIDWRGSAVLKHDLVSQETTFRSFGPAAGVSEFVFVANPAETAEDDGVLMGYVYDPDVGSSDLVILDAATLEIAASVHLPARVPQGFHGSWVAS